jgi:hypothetical protein
VGDCWWTLFFQRTVTTAIDDAEQWWVESYDHTGRHWSSYYYYYLPEGRWGRSACPSLKRVAVNNSAEVPSGPA